MIKVIWSKNATEELQTITRFWDRRNKSKTYSNKILSHIEITIKLIKQNNRLGIQSNAQNVRMRLILKNYYLVYEISEDQINILQVWDVRQNPIEIKFNKK